MPICSTGTIWRQPGRPKPPFLQRPHDLACIWDLEPGEWKDGHHSGFLLKRVFIFPGIGIFFAEYNAL